jgi:hypothetical protein
MAHSGRHPPYTGRAAAWHCAELQGRGALAVSVAGVRLVSRVRSGAWVCVLGRVLGTVGGRASRNRSSGFGARAHRGAARRLWRDALQCGAGSGALAWLGVVLLDRACRGGWSGSWRPWSASWARGRAGVGCQGKRSERGKGG